VRRRFTEGGKERIWDMHPLGVPVIRISRMMGRQDASMLVLISQSGGIRPRARVVNDRHLSPTGREEISRGLQPSFWTIA
jgi:hypothetical protein